MIGMTETVVQTDAEPEIDGELLAEAQRHLDGSSRNAAINAALEMYVEARRARRRAARERLQDIIDEGAFNWDAIDEVDK